MPGLVRALIVEDSTDDAALLERALREAGFEVVAQRVDTEPAMRDALSRRGWDVVLADSSLPGFDGLAALRVLEEQKLPIPLIIVSGVISEDGAAGAMRAGARDFVMKDNLGRLVPAVERELAQAGVRAERAHAERRMRFQAEILLQMREAVFAVDSQSFVTFWNHIAEQLYGVSAQEAFGRHVVELFSTQWPHEDDEQGKQLALERSGYWQGQAMHVTRSGRHMYVDLSLSLLKEEGGSSPGTLYVVRDVTERHLAEAKARRLHALQGALRKVNSLLLTARNEVELLQVSCRVLQDLDFVEHAWAACTDAAGRPVRTITAKGASPPGRETGALGGGPGLSLSLTADGVRYGTLEVRAKGGKSFGEENASFLSEVAGDLAVGLKSHRLEKSLAASLIDLRRMVSQTIDAVTSISERKDPYTAGHQRRVAQLSYLIASELGMSGEQAEQVRITATVHDVGKIGVPAELLAKPGRLSDEEMAIIRTHSRTGSEIMSTVDFSWPLCEIILQHHERLDGSGYPSGLKGGEILLEARIIAVADVVEAMSSHRPYRPTLGTEAALAEIEAGKGSAYDTEVVDTCLRLFRKGGFRFE